MTYKDQLGKVYSEIEIMKHLKESGGGHPNIVQLHEVLDDEDNDKLYMGSVIFSYWFSLVLDYCEKGELLVWD